MKIDMNRKVLIGLDQYDPVQLDSIRILFKYISVILARK